MRNCCTAIGAEIKGPMFDLTVLDNDKTQCIDIERTFSPRPRVLYIGAKVFIMAWIIAVLVSSITNKEHPDFWMAYLTHWGFLFTVAYSVMSVICAIVFAVRAPDKSGVLEGGVGFMVKTTWALFAIALPVEIMITILFWVLEFDGEVKYISVMVHGGGMALIVIDGFLLSRIPLRMKQFLLFQTFTILYLIWNVVHAYSGIGNPYNDGESQDDDAIYASLAWKNNTMGAAILSAGIVCVANPVLFLLCWAFARMLPKRLCDKDERRFKASLIEV
ncbi:hypothetical protein ACHAXR_002262 [Thalassiosira sp. AJA248-18]